MSISFEAAPSKIESKNIVKIPLSSSETMPSRGMVMVQGTMNDIHFKAPLEPDGKGGHFFEISDLLLEETGITAGQTMSFTVELLKEWIEPEIPVDIMDAIIGAGLLNQWNSLTTKARWEWVRWIRSTKNCRTEFFRR